MALCFTYQPKALASETNGTRAAQTQLNALEAMGTTPVKPARKEQDMRQRNQATALPQGSCLQLLTAF
jgi:hypothetical protein